MYNIDLDEIVEIQIYQMDRIEKNYFEMQGKMGGENE